MIISAPTTGTLQFIEEENVSIYINGKSLSLIINDFKITIDSQQLLKIIKLLLDANLASSNMDLETYLNFVKETSDE